jgi:hypothetical protein
MKGVLAVVPMLLVPLLAAGAPAPPPDAAECPAPAQQAAALNALVPGISTAPPASFPLTLANGLRLGLSTSREGDVRVEIADAEGEIVLHRLLPAPPRGRAPDCAALAETIALIVDRYLHDVGYEAPTPPPPPPPEPSPAPPPAPPTVVRAAEPPAEPAAHVIWRLGVAGSGRRGDVGGFDGDADLALGLEGAGDGPRWGGRLSAGYAPREQAAWFDKSATLRRVPLRLGVYLGLPAGPGRFEPGLGAGADLFIVSASGPGTTGGVHPSPSGDLSVAYTLPLIGGAYLRLLSRVALAVPYVFKALEVSTVWGTPRVYGEAGVELGFAFR